MSEHLRQENLWFFYKSSHGELHAGLPFLLEILKEKNALNAYFLYDEQKAYDSIPSFYKKIINQNFKVVKLAKTRLLCCFVNFFRDNNYLFTCDAGHTFYSRLLTCYWPFSRIAFFAHAYALLGDSLECSIVKNFNAHQDNLNGYHHYPLLVAHNETEIENRKKLGFALKNIIVAGNIGYQKEWVERYQQNSDGLDVLLERRQRFTKVILVPLRDSHNKYLSITNASYLEESVKEIVEANQDYLFLIKAHPRQKNIESFKTLENKFTNVQLVDFNTTVLAKLSDLVVSYWSSAITDALAVGTAVVEFHRHDIFHEQLVRTDHGLVSLYHYHGLCPFYQNKQTVLDLLKNPCYWNSIKSEQQIAFKKIFKKENPSFVEELFTRLNTVPFRKRYWRDVIAFPFTRIKNAIAGCNHPLK